MKKNLKRKRKKKMKSFKQFNEAGYTDRYAHQSVENDNVGILSLIHI